MPRLAVLGYPVGHSRSPAMHNAALAALGMADEWSYEAIEVAPEQFEAKVRSLAVGDFAGVNVTIPHKEAALALADETDQAAKAIGAANTLTFKSVGGIEADNTDAFGLLEALPIKPEGAAVMVLGAGGAARAAIWVLGQAGARVGIWNRTMLRAERLCREVGGKPVYTPDSSNYDLIVNTTSVGLGGEDPFDHLPLRRDGFRPEQVVVDMVYSEAPSTLLDAAAASGARTVDGIEVLVQQGALSFELWTGRKPPLDVMRAAARGEQRR